MMIKVEKIEKSFGTNEVIRGISFDINKGEVVSVIGPSGSGKSTMLRSLIGLEKIDKGSIYIENNSFVKNGVYNNDRDCRYICQKMGMVFQHFNLFPHMTVKQNLISAPLAVKKSSKRDVIEHCEDLLNKVGLSEKINEMPSNLSGGQKQRVAIARALMMEPDILFFDEPTSALDPELTGEVLAVMKKLASEKMTMIIVTHEMAFAKEIADRIIFMDNGLIIVDDTPDNVFNHSVNERMRSFLKSFSA